MPLLTKLEHLSLLIPQRVRRIAEGSLDGVVGYSVQSPAKKTDLDN